MPTRETDRGPVGRNTLHIGQVLDILVRRKARVADDVVKLCMRLFLHMRVRSQYEN